MQVGVTGDRDDAFRHDRTNGHLERYTLLRVTQCNFIDLFQIVFGNIDVGFHFAKSSIQVFIR